MSQKIGLVVLGSETAPYGIVQELRTHGVHDDIIVVDIQRRLVSRSRWVQTWVKVYNTPEAHMEALQRLSAHYDRLVLYPTLDSHLEFLRAIYDEVKDFCFVPMNPDTVPHFLDKTAQYDLCERLGVPYPRSRYLRTVDDYDALRDGSFPVLVKPQEKTTGLLHPKLAESPDDLERHREEVVRHLAGGLAFLASEFVPGDGSNVYAYVAFRTTGGEILNDWIGKKLSQYPHEYGVAASASNQGPPVLRELGRKLVEGMDLHGIVEPEFKYDARDGQYKLMEVNLRSMGWVHVGHLSGVPLHYTQYLHALGRPVPRFEQDQTRRIHFIKLMAEVNNLFDRPGYWPTFRSVFRDADRRVLALWDLRDPVPFLFYIARLVAVLGGRVLARMGLRRRRPDVRGPETN